MTRTHTLHLYRQLLRTATQFVDYNFRAYSVRVIRDRFHQHKTVEGAHQIQPLIKDAHEQLEVLKRQVIIHRLYHKDPYIIEKKLHEEGRTLPIFTGLNVSTNFSPSGDNQSGNTTAAAARS